MRQALGAARSWESSPGKGQNLRLFLSTLKTSTHQWWGTKSSAQEVVARLRRPRECPKSCTVSGAGTRTAQEGWDEPRAISHREQTQRKVELFIPCCFPGFPHRLPFLWSLSQPKIG